MVDKGLNKFFTLTGFEAEPQSGNSRPTCRLELTFYGTSTELLTLKFIPKHLKHFTRFNDMLPNIIGEMSCIIVLLTYSNTYTLLSLTFLKITLACERKVAQMCWRPDTEGDSSTRCHRSMHY